MPKTTELWPHQAMNEATEALDEYEKTGSREGFKKWQEKYNARIEEKGEAMLNGEDINETERNVLQFELIIAHYKILEYDEWYEKHQDELWIAYHEEGANYDTDYEDWCEKQYNKHLKGNR